VNASKPDRRLSVVPPSTFKGKRVLDIGCNEGWITIDVGERRLIVILLRELTTLVINNLAQYFSPSKAIGVDIDGDLIRAAWKRRRLVWSLQSPDPKPEVENDNGKRGTGSGKKTRSAAQKVAEPASTSDNPAEPSKSGYFPMAMEYMFGSLPIPPNEGGEPSFPNNLAFYTADWTKSAEDVDFEMDDQDQNAEEANELATGQRAIHKEDKEGYDVVLAFSVTKWIHLNGGDQGLLAFFRKLYEVLHSGGILLLEAQDWEGYAKAKKLSPELSENYKQLALRPADFPKILADVGFKETTTSDTDAARVEGKTFPGHC
jgi:SAM-dependent methyltransferase